MNKKLPLYKAAIDDIECGMFTISLVDNPAVQSDFLCFSSDENRYSFKVENEEQRILTGVIMRADFPIYRIGNSGYEYYIMFDKPTLEVMVEKWLAEGFHNSVNLQHNPDNYVQDVYLKEVYFKDVERGINPKGFESIEDGSLFGTYKVLNDDVWEKVKNGEFKGFSLEGVFNNIEVSMSDESEEQNYREIIETLSKIIDKKKNKK